MVALGAALAARSVNARRLSRPICLAPDLNETMQRSGTPQVFDSPSSVCNRRTA